MSDWTVALGPGGLGVLFAGISGARLLTARRLRSRGIAAQAVVVDQRGTASPASAGSAAQLQRPVLVFTTREGRRVQVTSSAGTDQPDLLPGHVITVYYDPADPHSVSVPEQETGVYRLLLAIGVFLLAIAVAVLLLGSRLLPALIAIPAFLGAVFTAVGWVGIGKTRRLQRGGRTDGVVVGAVTSESRNGLTLYHPVVRYHTAAGAVFESPARHGHVSRPPAPGTPMRVRYDPANPQRMMLAHDHAPPVFWIFGIIGPILLLIGLAIIVAVAT